MKMIFKTDARGGGRCFGVFPEMVAEGNPGCLAFLIELMKLPDGDEAILRLAKYGITGSRAYQLWNDCCDRNTQLAAEILEAVAIGKLTLEELRNHVERPWGERFDIEEIRKRAPKTQPDLRKAGEV